MHPLTIFTTIESQVKCYTSVKKYGYRYENILNLSNWHRQNFGVNEF